jgi:Transglutaminase-like superfamily
VRIGPDVLLVRAPDGSGRLLDLDGSFYALDPIAVELLEDVARRGRAETVRAAARRYRVPEQRVAGDLDELLADLPPGVGTGEPTPGSGGGDRLAVAALALLSYVRPARARVWTRLVAARICFATVGWSRTLRWWTALPASSRRYGGSPAELDLRVRRTATGSVLGHTCKERAVVGLAEARSAGLGAAVVLGISFYPLATHSWCVLDDGAVLGDLADVCAAFEPVALHR